MYFKRVLQNIHLFSGFFLKLLIDMALISLCQMDTLYISSHPEDFRSLLPLIAAEFGPSPPRIVHEDPPAEVARSRPALVLAGSGGTVLTGANAVSWYLAAAGTRTGSDKKQESQVWQWLSFAENELMPVACAVTFPLLGIMGVDKKVCICRPIFDQNAFSPDALIVSVGHVLIDSQQKTHSKYMAPCF